MPDQHDRIQKHHEAPHNLIDSTLYGLWGGRIARWTICPVRKLLAYPIDLLEFLPAHFVGILLIVAAYRGPSIWAAAWGDLSVWAYILLATWGVFLLNGIDYALEVILRVPWCAPRTYPIIARVDFFPRPDRKLGLLSLVVGTVCLLPVLLFAISHQVQPLPAELLSHERVSGNGVALATNGLVFLIFGMFQLWLAYREPAWPFVRRTQENDLIARRQADQIRTARPQPPLAPPTPPQHAPRHPDGQAPAPTNTAGKTGLPNDYPVPFAPRAATKTFDDIHGMDELKDRLAKLSRRAFSTSRRSSRSSTLNSEQMRAMGMPRLTRAVFSRASSAVPTYSIPSGRNVQMFTRGPPSSLTLRCSSQPSTAASCRSELTLRRRLMYLTWLLSRPSTAYRSTRSVVTKLCWPTT